MASESSFDVVSKADLQKIQDAVNVSNKEISVRFDFRGSSSRLEFKKDVGEIILYSDDEQKLKSVVDILKSRSAKQSVDLKAYDYQKIEKALGGKIRQLVKVIQGISAEKAKMIVADIKKMKSKSTPSNQGDHVRVSSKSKDVLQDVMTELKSKDYGLPLQFTNYR